MEYLWLCLSAGLAGAVNAIAGGGTLLTFPALESVVAADIANGTSTLALFPGSIASVWGYRQQMQACRSWLIWLTPPSIVGGAVGASLVEAESFRQIIPWLILSAALLFLLQPAIARLFRHPTQALRMPSRNTLLVIILVQFFIGVYGGYFGAGIGILMLSSLSYLGLQDIHQVNALKSFLAFCMNAVAAVIFSAHGLVHWRYALVMAAVAILGGYLGARLSLRLPPAVVRWTVIALGFGLAAYYFGKEFGLATEVVAAAAGQ